MSSSVDINDYANIFTNERVIKIRFITFVFGVSQITEFYIYL